MGGGWYYLGRSCALSAEETNSLDNINLIGNAISGLNPMDIEKIDIPADAAATAIYGVRVATVWWW